MAADVNRCSLTGLQQGERMLQTGSNGYPAHDPLEDWGSVPFSEFDLDIRLGENVATKLHLCEKTQEASGCGLPTGPACNATKALCETVVGCPVETIACTKVTCETCRTCETQCDQATCAGTCQTCATRCEQHTCGGTCETCATKCEQHTCGATCATCKTQCEQATCAKGTCVTCRIPC
jgi:hypothetical protein